MRILVIEDFAPIREAVAQGLREAGYAVDESDNGRDALLKVRLASYDVIVLDLMLPIVDGLSVLKQMREKKTPGFVLILTARDMPGDRVRGLDMGADDYLVKPFVFAELLARVRALIRRKYDVTGSLIRVGDLEVDVGRRVVRRSNDTINLSGREYALLEYLAMNANRIVTRSDIWEHVYDFNATLESNVVDVYIGLLRKKIERPPSPRLIHTRRGQGYMLGESV